MLRNLPQKALTGLLLQYFAKYLKNVKDTELQFSLWGGDVVLNDLELRLGVINDELHFAHTTQHTPLFALTRGFIQELRISIPWSRITSTPVKVSQLRLFENTYYVYKTTIHVRVCALNTGGSIEP